MKRFSFLILLINFVALGLWGHNAIAQLPNQTAGNAEDILQYLDHLISWHRAINSIDASGSNAQELLLADAIKQNSLKALRGGFDYARAEAPILDAAKSEPAHGDAPVADNRQQELNKNIAATKKRIDDMQNELQQTKISSSHTKAATREALAARRDVLKSGLQLAQAQLSLLQSVMKTLNNNTDASGAGNVLGHINDLERSVPELRSAVSPKTQVAVTPTTTTVQTTTHAEAPGIFGLISENFDIYRRKNELAELVTRTAALRQANAALRNSLKNSLRASMQSAMDITQSQVGNDLQKLGDQKEQLDDLLDRFQDMSTAVTPLVEQGIWLDCASKNLLDWNAALNMQMSSILRSLVLRLVMLGFAIMIPLIVSEILRRATVRYVKEPRWQQQLRRVRQVVVWIIILLIVIMSFSSEFGSLATFAGFITAGLAVALQNVILSAVAYFFFFGRFGVRVGDRVSVMGVTGDVIQIGLVRLYLMELGGTNLQLYPTGRIVVFPNSILFQNNAFFKQVPGTSYTWHEITLPLAQDTDYETANNELLAAVNSIYDGYKQNMERQQSALMESTRLQVELPHPRGSLRFNDNGLAFVIRYPVEILRASEIDDRITKQLLRAITEHPELKLSGAPKIETVNN